MKTKIVSINDILPNEWNPNEMSVDVRTLLADNLKRIGMVDPILVVSNGNGKYRIIDGEQRYIIAQSIGYKELPVVILDIEMPVVEQKKQTIRMNQIKGQLGHEKFGRLVDSIQKKIKIDTTELPFELGFASAAEFQLLYDTGPRRMMERRGVNETEGSSIPLNHLYRIAEQYINGEKSGCFIIVHIDKDHSLLLEFDDTGLLVLEQARERARINNIEFEGWLLNAIRSSNVNAC